MRIGILTLHDSVNYGAVLQAYAMRRFLSDAGHEAFVIDRRRSPGGVFLRTPLPGAAPRPGCTWVAEAVSGVRDFRSRCRRTESFLRDRVGLSAYHFNEWTEAPERLGADAVVVGSDQVWNPDNVNLDDYLRLPVPSAVRLVAYGASTGGRPMSESQRSVFRLGLPRFAKIAVRERESVGLIESFGCKAETVVDPVLLLPASHWRGFGSQRSRGGGGLTAYFLAEDVPAMLPELAGYAEKTSRRVSLYVDWFSLPSPKSLRQLREDVLFWRKWEAAGVDFRLDAGPEEFVRGLASADAVVSNSYHALMFSCVFGKEVRIVLPTHPVRRRMNCRLLEFAEMARGPLIVGSLAEALGSLVAGARVAFDRDAVGARIHGSGEWLRQALAT